MPGEILKWKTVHDGLGSVERTGRPENPSFGWIEDESTIRAARAENVNCHVEVGMVAEERAVVCTVWYARIQFHLHRVCAPACKLRRVMKLTPPNVKNAIAQSSDEDQIEFYSKSNNVPMSPLVRLQISLPIRSGGHGFTPLATLNIAAYAASLIDSQLASPTEIRPPTMNPAQQPMRSQMDIYWTLPIDSTRPSPQRTEAFQKHSPWPLSLPSSILQAVSYIGPGQSAAMVLRKDDDCARFPNPAQHSDTDILHRIRQHVYLETPGAAFLTAHPSVVTHVYDEIWSAMLRRHLGVPVFDDTALPLCAECNTVMDHIGGHAADLCHKGLGWKNCHEAVAKLLGKDLFQATGAGVSYEVPYLLPGLDARPADVLVQPTSSIRTPTPPLPVAYHVTVSSPFQQCFLSRGAQKARSVAIAAERRKLRDFATKLTAIPGQRGRSELGWRFVPLAFDSLGSPSDTSSEVIQDHVAAIAARIGSSKATVTSRLHRKLSYAIWSTCAASILGRRPQPPSLVVARNLTVCASPFGISQ